MRIPSGMIDQKVYFIALDTGLTTRVTGLSSFTVYRSRNGGTATVYTTPTVAELSAANMPGVYCLTVDEDTTIASTSDSEEYAVHITATGMAPVTRTIELYRRDTTSGRTLDVSAGGEAGVDWANVGSPTTTVGLTGTTISTSQVVASVTALTTTNISDAVWDKATSGHTTSGTFGEQAKTDIDAILAFGAPPSAATIAGAVWNEDATGHQTTGTFGQAIGDPVADTNTIYKAVVTDGTAATVGLDVVAVLGRLPAALVSGRMDASVGAMAAGTVTAAAIATDAIDNDAIAANAVTEIQSGLATAASITTLTGYVDTEVASILAAVDTEVAAIKAKTDQLVFTVANQVDVNLQSVNETAVTGSGTGPSPWGP